MRACITTFRILVIAAALMASVTALAIPGPVHASSQPNVIAAQAPPGPQGPVGQAQAAGNPDNDPITGKSPQNSSVLDYVNSGYQFMAIIGGLLAIMMLIYAGYRYMTSYGDPEKISDAKDIVEKAFIGLGLLILAAVILNTINPRTSQDVCTPGEPNCGTIDFSKPKG